MTLLVTGAWGIVGRETVREAASDGHTVRAFDLPTPANRRRARRAVRAAARQRSGGHVEPVWGSLTDIAALDMACLGADAVIHLGAVIPPAADRAPDRARLVNVEGTELLMSRLGRQRPGCRFIYASSIAVYGDRRRDPLIHDGDEPHPGAHDAYAHQKLEAEALVRESGLGWDILRLTYVVSPDKLAMDPLMFEMPLDTPIEVCHARDVARAFVRAAEAPAHRGTWHIAGGEACRTTFGAYLGRMLELFGFGRRTLPAELWSDHDFHCAWMDTSRSQEAFRFQGIDLETYYREVGRVSRFKRWLISLVRPAAWAWLLGRSPHGGKRVVGKQYAVEG